MFNRLIYQHYVKTYIIYNFWHHVAAQCKGVQLGDLEI